MENKHDIYWSFPEVEALNQSEKFRGGGERKTRGNVNTRLITFLKAQFFFQPGFFFFPCFVQRWNQENYGPQRGTYLFLMPVVFGWNSEKNSTRHGHLNLQYMSTLCVCNFNFTNFTYLWLTLYAFRRAPKWPLPFHVFFFMEIKIDFNGNLAHPCGVITH